MHITPEEYQALPLSVQKKYFSSVERLRILQQTAAEKRNKQPPPPREPSLDAVSPRISHSSRAFTPRAYRKSSAASLVVDVNEDQARRFLALPDKVKRTHFSEVELVLLTESSERVLGLLEEGSVPQSLHNSRSASVVSSTSLEDAIPGSGWLDVKGRSFGSTGLRSEPDLTAPLWSPHQHDNIRWTRAASASVVEMTLANNRKKSCSSSASSKRRTTSLAPLPLRPRTLLPPVPASPQVAAIDDLNAESDQSPSEGSRQKETQYYRDSQSRSKLRAFLTSPEKFDEALEFGFPAELLETKRKSVTCNVTAPREASDEFELSDDDDEDEDLFLPESRPSSSPTDSTAFSVPATLHGSMDSGVALPLYARKGSVRSLTPDLDGREMTLRLTLTRKDLRVPEQELYSFQRTQVSGVHVETSDPLALENLQFCDDHSGNHGAFAVHNRISKRGLKKVWSSIRKR